MNIVIVNQSLFHLADDIIADTQALYHWDGMGWQKQPSQYDPKTGRLVATLTQTGLMAVFSEQEVLFLPSVSKRH